MTLMQSQRARLRMNSAGRTLVGAAALVLAGCAVGPAYHRPTAATPTGFKEAPGWKKAAPADTANRGPWWEVFHDPVLNDLEQQVATANQTLKQAEANYQQARQLARATRSSLWPSLSVGGSAQRSRNSLAAGSYPKNAFDASLQAAWEPDLWGQVRRSTEAAQATAQASAAQVAAVRLSLEATLAQDYLALRVIDERQRLLSAAVTAYRHTLNISENRYRAGVISRRDVVSAQTQLDNARAQVIDVAAQRARLEHAMAVLVGQPPSALSIKPVDLLSLEPPEIPPAVPAELLERRPDIAEAERQVAAANARVGLQVAGWFPTVTLSATGGYQSGVIDQLFNLPNRVWSLGVGVSESLLDWGKRSADVAAARAAYDASVAGYRQSVLGAFQEVEDNLASLRVLQEEAKVQNAAVAEAVEAARISTNEYDAGTVDFVTVATAQVAELNSRLAALSIRSERLAASVGLIAALGGGWKADELLHPQTMAKTGIRG